MATWPETLPQEMMIEGYDRSPGNNILRSSMDAGPDKSRRRFTAVPKEVNGKVFLNATQLDTFIAWYEDDLLDGNLRFDWVDHKDGTTEVEYKFLAPYTAQPMGEGYWTINMQLEILP
jgi:hypothetical protein